MSETTVSFSAGQIQGARDEQEDRVLAGPLGASEHMSALLIVADGMGGHAAGALAADTAIRAFRSAMEAAAGAPRDHFRVALDAANLAVKAISRTNPQYDGMGCTLVAAAIKGSELAWISVGDSALMLVRDGTVRRLNADHSMRTVLDDLAASGRISREDAARDSQRNALRSAVTGDTLELVDNPGTVFPLRAGDRVMVLSDGMETLSPEQLAAIATQSDDPAAIVDTALKAVESIARPSQDNASLALYCHRAEAATLRRSRKWMMPLLLSFVFLAATLAAWVSVSAYQNAKFAARTVSVPMTVSKSVPKSKSAGRHP